MSVIARCSPSGVRAALVPAVVLAGVLLAGCSASSAPATHSSTPSASGTQAGQQVIRVPQDAKTVNAALARVRPGGMVLLGPGVYRQTIQVNTPRVTLRGTERAKVIVDGGVLRANGVVLTKSGDAVQNLTVRNATLNGVLVTGQTDSQGRGIGRGSDGYSPADSTKRPPLDGFLVDHVTSYNNGLYGIYAFSVRNGVIKDSYASGMADSGLYVGQCKPCGVSVYGNVAERNAVGYEGTNASGDMYVYGNRFVGNRVGATTDSDHQEAFLPQSGAVVAGNVIAANSQAKTPEQADGGFGIGFGIAGGTHNTVRANLIEANPVAGVVITNTDDLPPVGNQIVANDFRANGRDFVYSAAAAAAGSGNCLQANVLTAGLAPRDFPRRCPSGAAVRAAAAPVTNAPPGIAFTEVAAPPPLPELPNALTAAPVSTTGLPGRVDVASIRVPGPSLLAAQSSIRW